MANVGYATLSIIPSAKGMLGNLRKEVDPATTAAGKSGGQSFSKSFTSGMKGVVGSVASGIGGAVKSIASTVTSGLSSAAAVAGGLFATSLVKGFGRLTAIDDAQGKLKGLGHTTEGIAEIMDSALAAVRGTAFGLGDAATVAATAVAAGIAPGEELTRYLTLIGDASTIAGVSMSEMGAIINKTTTSGKVFTAELNQLADRGLPIFTWLQEEYGVSAEALRDMVSAGEIDSERFRSAIEQNIGGAALASGETFRGAWANVGAALGRFGAKVLEPFFEAGKDVFPGFIAVIDELSNRVGPAISRLADSDGFARVLDFFGSLPDLVGPALDKLGEVGPALAPIAGLFAALASSKIAGALGPLGAIVPTIGPLVGLFAGLVAASPELRAALGEVFAMLGPVIAEIGGTLGPALKQIVPVLGGAFAKAITAVAKALVPVLPQLAELAVILIEKVGVPVIVAIADAVAVLADGFAWLAENVSWFVPALAGLTAGIWLLNAAMNANPISLLAIAIGAAVVGIIYAYQHFETFRNVVDAVGRFFRDTLWPALQAVFDWLRDKVPPILQAVFGWLRDNVPPILQAVAGFFTDKVLPALQKVWGFIQDNLFPIFQAVFGWLLDNVPTIIGAVVGAIQTFWGWLQTLWDRSEGVRSFLVGAFKSAWSAVSEAIGIVTAAASDLWSGLKTLWDNSEPFREFLVGAFWLGITVVRTAFEAVVTAVTSVWNWFQWVWDKAGEVATYFEGPMGTALDFAKGAWELVGDAISGVVGFLIDVIDKAKTAVEWLGKVKSFTPLSGDFGTPDNPKNGKPRASGGPVFSGELYRVGERGWEYFVPAVDGEIINHQDSLALASGRGGVHIEHAEFHDATDLDGFARVMNFQLAG